MSVDTEQQIVDVRLHPIWAVADSHGHTSQRISNLMHHILRGATRQQMFVCMCMVVSVCVCVCVCVCLFVWVWMFVYEFLQCVCVYTFKVKQYENKMLLL